MAHHKSAVKRNRQSKKRNAYNRLNKKLVKDAVKAVRGAKTYTEGLPLLHKAISVLDKVTAHGVIHKNTAANRKSSLALYINKLKPQA